jgi:pyruvate/2-oxoacid:ferredoxin oxidoreductase beta subunit
MDNLEFKKLLVNAKLTKKEFSQIFNISQTTVNGWGTSGKGFPYWVKSWLENYIELQQVKEELTRYKLEEEKEELIERVSRDSSHSKIIRIEDLKEMQDYTKESLPITEELLQEIQKQQKEMLDRLNKLERKRYH